MAGGFFAYQESFEVGQGDGSKKHANGAKSRMYKASGSVTSS